jgi:hypothetical protein
MQRATYEDAALIMRLYELRREEKLRKAREWFLADFKANSIRDIEQHYPHGSEQNAYMRMVISYWDMAASFLMREIVHEELFFENSGELLGVWERIKPFVEDVRTAMHNPTLYRHLEKAAQKHMAWLEQNAPGAYEAYQARIKNRK